MQYYATCLYTLQHYFYYNLALHGLLIGKIKTIIIVTHTQQTGYRYYYYLFLRLDLLGTEVEIDMVSFVYKLVYKHYPETQAFFLCTLQYTRIYNITRTKVIKYLVAVCIIIDIIMIRYYNRRSLLIMCVPSQFIAAIIIIY